MERRLGSKKKLDEIPLQMYNHASMTGKVRKRKKERYTKQERVEQKLSNWMSKTKQNSPRVLPRPFIKYSVSRIARFNDK